MPKRRPTSIASSFHGTHVALTIVCCLSSSLGGTFIKNGIMAPSRQIPVSSWLRTVGQNSSVLKCVSTKQDPPVANVMITKIVPPT